MKRSFGADIRVRFVIVYIIVIVVVFIVADLQYIALVKDEIDVYIKTAYSVGNIDGLNIIQYSILNQEIPIDVTNISSGEKSTLYYTPIFNYYSFITKPLIAITLLVILIYLLLNRFVQNWLIRLKYFEIFLHNFFKNSRVDTTLLNHIKKRNDEICRLSLDVTQLMDDNIDISNKQKNFLKILEELNEVVLVISNEFTIIQHNKSWHEFKDKSDDFLFYLEDENVEKLLSELEELVNKVDKKLILIDMLHTKENYYEIKIIHIEGVLGVIIRDVTTRHLEFQETKHKALHDSLTALPNRNLFLDRLESEVKKSQRSEKKFALLFFDLNKFKSINDNHGHEAGDYILVEFARRISSILRASDTLARLGGDEFVAILPDIAHLDEVERVIDKILNALVKPFSYKDVEINLSTSIGVSICPDDGYEVEALILKADKAMYKSKKTSQKYFKYEEEL